MAGLGLKEKLLFDIKTVSQGKELICEIKPKKIAYVYYFFVALMKRIIRWH